MPIAARAPVALGAATWTHRRRAVNAAREGRCLMANLRAGLIGSGMMGRHHARVLGALEGSIWSQWPTPAATPTVWPAGRRVLASVEALDRGGHRLLPWSRCRRSSTRRSASTLAEAGVHAMVEKPLAQDTAVGDRTWPRPSEAGARRRRRAHRAVQPGVCNKLELGWRPVSSVRSTRSSPAARDRSRPGSPTSGWSRTSATHDIDLTAWVTGRPYVSVSAHTAHRSGREHEDLGLPWWRLVEGHGHQPSRELALAAQGAGHDHHRRTGHIRGRHADRRPDLLCQRRDRDHMGRHREVPRGVGRRRHPLRNPQARTLAR